MTSPFPVPLVPSNLARPPVFWSAPEVKAWVEFCVQEFSLAPITFDRFDMNGKALTLLTRSDFMERAPHAGDVLYNAFRHLCVASVSGNGANYTLNAHVKTPVYFSTHKDAMSQQDFLHPSMVSRPPTPSLFIPILPHPSTPKPEDREVPFKTDVIDAESVPVSILSPAATDKSLSDTESYNESSPKVCEASIESKTPDPMPISDCKDLQQHVDKLCDQKTECRLLWEFIYQLLLENKNKDLVCWESVTDLVFRINDPVSLAEQWGSQKNRSNMTYEKLSRALRYYYKMNIIHKVPGKKLTYQFMQSPKNIRKGQRGAKPHSHRCQNSIDNSQDDLPTPGTEVDSQGKMEPDFFTHSSSSPSQPVSSPLSTNSSIIHHRNEKESLDNEGVIPETTTANDSLIYSKCATGSSDLKSRQSHCSNDVPDNHITKFNNFHKNRPVNFAIERQPSCDHTCIATRLIAKEENSQANLTENVLASNITMENKKTTFEDMETCSTDMSSQNQSCLTVELTTAASDKSQTMCEHPSTSLSSFNDFQKMNIARMTTTSSQSLSTNVHSKDDLDTNDNIVILNKKATKSISDPPIKQTALFTNHDEFKSSKYQSENVIMSKTTDLKSSTTPHILSQRSLTNSPDIQKHKLPEGFSFHRNNNSSSGLNYHHMIRPAHLSNHHHHHSPYTIPIPLAHMTNKSRNLMYEPSYNHHALFKDTNNIHHWLDDGKQIINPNYCNSAFLERTCRNHSSLFFPSTPLSEDPNGSSRPLKKHKDSLFEYRLPSSKDRNGVYSFSLDLPEDLSVKKDSSTIETLQPTDKSNTTLITESTLALAE